MISYQVSIGFVIITILLCAGTLNLDDIVTAQDTRFGLFGWYWLPLFSMFVIFFFSALAETNRSSAACRFQFCTTISKSRWRPANYARGQNRW
jgi:NADH:ubiquinone oxidoreductase subunit H